MLFTLFVLRCLAMCVAFNSVCNSSFNLIVQISIHPKFLEALFLAYHIYWSNFITSCSLSVKNREPLKSPSRLVRHVLFFKGSGNIFHNDVMQTACGACSLVQQMTVTASEDVCLQMTLISTTVSVGIFKLTPTCAICYLLLILDDKSS